jgi:kynurenine formamidase
VTLPDLGRLRVFDLERTRTATDPIHPGHQPPGFSYLLHRHHGPGPERRSSASGVVVTSEHAGTHIDALSHQALDEELYGGRPAREIQTQFGFRELGAEALDPIFAHGILVDLVRHRGSAVEPGRWITLEEVRAAAAAQHLEPAPGDVVLVRTGNGATWGDAARYLRGSGMAGPVSRWLAEAGVRAVGADNVAWDWTGEPDPELGVTLPGHVILLVQSGIPIIENLDLEELGEAGVREFLFCCLPLKLKGVTASPVRPVALAEA